MQVNNNIIIPIATTPPQPPQRTEVVTSVPSSIQQTEVCSSQASKAAADRTKVLFNIRTNDINQAKKDLLELAKFCNEDTNLKTITGGLLEEISDIDEFLEPFKEMKYIPDFNPSKRYPALKELSQFISDESNRSIIEKTGDSMLADIIVNGKNPIRQISPRSLNNLRLIIENPDFKDFAENITEDKISEVLMSKTPESVVERNISLLADAYKNGNYLQKTEIKDPSLFLYNGDLQKLLQTIKARVQSLKENEKLTFDYDYTTGETRIHTAYEAGEDLIIQHIDYYDGNLKQTGELSSVEGRNANGVKTHNSKFKDFATGVDYYSKSFYEEDEKKWYLEQSSRIKKDTNGKVVEIEVTKPSAIDGVMNVKTMDANGKIHTKISTERTSKDTRVVKNLISPDGTVTKVRYILSNDLKNEAFGYQVSDKDGNILAQKTDYKTRISDNLTRENINGHYYRISSTPESIRVYDELTHELTVLDMKKLAQNDKADFINFLKKLSAPELIALNKNVKALEKSEFADSAYSTYEKIIKSDYDTFCFEHELGHAKDRVTTESMFKMLSLDKSDMQYQISNDKELQRIFNEEKRIYDKTYPLHIRKKTQYFTGNTPLNGDNLNRMREAVAEANSLTQGIHISKWVTERAMLLQENFPRTIAYLMQHKF